MVRGTGTTEDGLLQALDDPDVRHNTSRRNVIRKRLAALGTYCTNCPDNDELIKEHCRLGHRSIEQTVRYLKSFMSKAEMDVAGRFTTKPIASYAKYEIVFVDDYSGHAKLYGMSDLAHVPAVIDQYYQWLASKGHTATGGSLLLETDGTIQVETGRRIRGDSASYFKSGDAVRTYNKHSVTLETSSPNCQFHNGTAERYWRTCHGSSMAMRDAAGLDMTHWLHSDLHATRIHNMLPGCTWVSTTRMQATGCTSRRPPADEPRMSSRATSPSGRQYTTESGQAKRR